MYHGGNNPEGKLTTLNEQQASSYTITMICRLNPMIFRLRWANSDKSILSITCSVNYTFS